MVIIGIIVIFEAAIVSVMNDSSKKMPNPAKSFHKWLIIWAAVNSAALIIGTYIFTGTFLGFEL